MAIIRFETLSQLHLNDRWYGEAAVCQSHITAIMAKQLSLRGNSSYIIYTLTNV